MRDLVLLKVLTLLVCSAYCCHSLVFTAPTKHRVAVVSTSTYFGLGNHEKRQHNSPEIITMRDASSAYWFSMNDSVRVVNDVRKAGVNLKGRIGTVVETWEKCDVDPTCCCAEQVDVGMAVRVEFPGTELDASETGSFMHYFAEEELVKVQDDATATTATIENKEAIPFDGMSCKAFKLEHLKMGEQAKRIAAYEQSRTDNNNQE